MSDETKEPVSTGPAEGRLSLAERQRRRTEAINARVDDLAEEAGGDLARAERRAAGTIILGAATTPLLIGILLVVAALFLPHSGEVRGFDVLLFTERSDRFLTTMPERIFVWLAFVGGILLTVATLISKATIVGWANWVVSGIGVFYCFLAVGMRNTRGPDEPGRGPGIGLWLAGLGLLVIVVALSTRIFRRTAVQAAINARRRAAADRDEASQAAQQRLRVGMAAVPRTVDVDDRRARATARRRAREERLGETAGRTPGEDGPDNG
ncbi:hypothetical protein [uncultured Corynebacterium sp.]|uniref:Rv2732c family membrane protein n=1 Tax=uncultured Corynebacterium sp. TaxID=159447 RepID=UPI0025D3CA11|nr:hypothetical protein [uncultured Corynebacterium sp.]